VNLDPHRTLAVDGTLAGLAATTVSGQVLSAGEMDAHNTFASPHTLEPKSFTDARLRGGRLSVVLPAKAVVVLSLK
jgi:alpha-L-arabinofuranosidase